MSLLISPFGNLFVSSERKEEIQRILNTVYDDDDYIPKTLVDKFVRHDGEEFWVELKVIPIGSKEKPDIQIVFRDVTDKKNYESQLEYLAYHDPLTGLKNRRIFTDIANESIEYAKRANGKLAVMYIDLDNFKSINDTYGHDVGDQLLQNFASRLRDSVRNKDVLSRVGGDEFLVLLNDLEEDYEIVHIANRMIAKFKENYQINNYEFPVTSSIGVAVFPKDGDNSNTLISKADQALYQAKKEKNQFMIYE